MPRTDIDRLEQLVASRHACISILTFEEEHAVNAAREVAMTRGCDLWTWSCSTGLRDGLMKEAVAIRDTEHPAAALYFLLTNPAMRGIVAMLDLGTHLRDDKTLRLLRDLLSRDAEPGRLSVVLIDSTQNLPAVISGTAAKVELSFPGEAELLVIVRTTCQELMRDGKLQVELRKEDLDAVVRNLQGLTRRQARAAVLEAVAVDRVFDATDVRRVLDFKQKAIGSTGLLEFVKAPATLDQVGGLTRLKSWLELRAEGFEERAREFGLTPPRGVLLLGVQGAGKSLAAKAVATAWRRPLLRMDVGAFFNRYIGETERNMRDALRQAEMMSPVVLWIDEIEKAFASASGQSSADGGLGKRMFGTMLTWMQEHTSPVFLIATANDIEALPPELLRKGRFDEIFFVDLPGDDARRAIFRIHLSKRNRDPKLYDLDKLVVESTGFSGAEIEQAIVSGLYTAFSKSTELSDGQIIAAMRASPPLSVVMREKIRALRAWAADRCVPAD
jgi:ATP-dependent 26S proteasome regulatory subunit